MKKLILLLCVMFLVTSCANTDLPPEPDVPGTTGNYYRYIDDWATEATNVKVDEQFLACSSGEEVPLIVESSADDYTYKYFYIWDESYSEWDRYKFPEDTLGSSNWISGDARFKVYTNCDDLQDLADENNELFVVGYTCSKNGDVWDCHGNKWQLDIAEVQVNSKICVDSDGGMNYYTKGYAYETPVGSTNDTVVIQAIHQDAQDYCDLNTGYLKEYYCKGNDLQVISGYECPYGCSDGACIDLPDDPNGPGSFDSETYLELNVPKIVDVQGNSYTLELVGADSGDVCEYEVLPNIVLNINGESYPFSEGDYRIIEGVYYYAKDIFITNVPYDSVAANILVQNSTLFLETNSTASLNLSSGPVSMQIIDYNEGDCLEYSSNTPSAIIDVNGVRKTLHEGQQSTINGLDVFAKDIFVTNIPTPSASANVVLSVGVPIIPSNPIPVDCVSWYDGCNTCGVINGDINGCTKKYCEIYDEPECLSYRDDFEVAEIQIQGEVVVLDFINENEEEHSFEVFGVRNNQIVYADGSENRLILFEDMHFVMDVDGITELFVVDSISYEENEIVLYDKSTGLLKTYQEGDEIGVGASNSPLYIQSIDDSEYAVLSSYVGNVISLRDGAYITIGSNYMSVSDGIDALPFIFGVNDDGDTYLYSIGSLDGFDIQHEADAVIVKSSTSMKIYIPEDQDRITVSMPN